MVNAFQINNIISIISRPIMQMPSEIVAVQEIIWKIKPDLIIETGKTWWISNVKRFYVKFDRLL